MAEEGKGGKGLFKTLVGAGLGLFSGAAAMYATAVFNTVVKPPLPVANFAVAADGLTVTCQNQAAGESGWWDFGDGSPLEPFDANEPSHAHTYAKPGSYAVKLTVRNFLMDENSRSVPVDLSAASAPQQLPPTVTALKVEPIGPRAVAPAAFRIKGEVENAERVIWDLGGDKLEVSTENGTFERLVVFDQPGQFPIQVTGLSGKQAVRQWAAVRVDPPTAGTLSVVLRVIDGGTRVERQTRTPSVPIPIPTKGSKAIDRTFPALPGYAITDAKLGKVASAAVKNLKVEVAADRKSVKLTGEWTATGDAAAKAAGGSDVIVPLVLTEEKTVSVQAQPQQTSATFPTGTAPSVTLQLPPQPLAGVQRRMQLELRQAGADVRSRVLLNVPDVKLPWSAAIPGAQPGGPRSVSATLVGDKVQVTLGY